MSLIDATTACLRGTLPHDYADQWPNVSASCSDRAFTMHPRALPAFFDKAVRHARIVGYSVTERPSGQVVVQNK